MVAFLENVEKTLPHGGRVAQEMYERTQRAHRNLKREELTLLAFSAVNASSCALPLLPAARAVADDLARFHPRYRAGSSARTDIAGSLPCSSPPKISRPGVLPEIRYRPQ